MKKFFRFFAYFSAFAFFVSGFGIYLNRIPTVYHCYPGEEPTADFYYTLEADTEAVNQTESDSYTAKIKLFGFLPFKDATIRKISQKQLTVLGTPFGVKLYTKGVIVVDAEEGSAGIEAGIQVGDIILSYNNTEVRSNEELREQVQLSEGQKQKVRILRNQRTQTVWVTPTETEDGYAIGLWVRDSTAGLGTLTYYDPETGTVAGLGHSISDVDTGLTMPVDSGTLVTANITGIKAGEAGAPGELLGYLEDRIIGTVNQNNDAGIFGTCTDSFSGVSYPIALKDEIEEGEAQILCTLAGNTAKSYTIEITRINNNLEEYRNLCITVTDPELLALTGGIVQGMSGSPIIQNGKLIGAVTHVLISDPTSGYGIFIENMLSAAE
ncbi:MAG: SpoIVB peptidase [Clostridia bacterium]|nr:SpoIVB peptidase [Clostridia bacterium]